MSALKDVAEAEAATTKGYRDRAERAGALIEQVKAQDAQVKALTDAQAALQNVNDEKDRKIRSLEARMKKAVDRRL